MSTSATRSLPVQHLSISAVVRGLGGCALLLIASAGLQACSDEADHSTRTVARGSEAHKVAWLEVGAPVTPAQWLVSRDEATARAVSDPAVRQVAGALKAAHARYRETERMIANRAVQLSEMLAGIGVTEQPIALVADLTDVADSGAPEGFGGVAQHYFNLRSASVARDAALATLKAHYGAQSKI